MATLPPWRRAVRGAGAGLAAALLLAGGAGAQASAALTVAPTTVRPGQAIHVHAGGLTLPTEEGTALCLGILGPGRNLELGRSPAFRPQIGTVAINAAGSGDADVTVPTDLVAGSYRVVVGGCSPHGNIAPLGPVASATLTVVVAAPAPTPPPPTPRSLPATGGGWAAACHRDHGGGASCQKVSVGP